MCEDQGEVISVKSGEFKRVWLPWLPSSCSNQVAFSSWYLRYVRYSSYESGDQVIIKGLFFQIKKGKFKAGNLKTVNTYF